jgi:hypothetical protein
MSTKWTKEVEEYALNKKYKWLSQVNILITTLSQDLNTKKCFVNHKNKDKVPFITW